LTASTIGAVVFGLYLVAIIALGLIASRYQKTEADFWVAGRRFGLGVLVMANMAAVMHGGAILSGIAYTGTFGGVAILPYISFVCGAAIIFYLFGGFTIPDYMGDRFDSRGLRAWSALVVAVSSIVYLIAQLRGMAFILERLLGLEFMVSLMLGTVIFVAYVALGGLLAVVWTNIAQFLFMWVGLLILVPYVYEAVLQSSGPTSRSSFSCGSVFSFSYLTSMTRLAAGIRYCNRWKPWHRAGLRQREPDGPAGIWSPGI
jgi:cation/acetate symporter